jgi:large subunit ribosomal protein L9
MKVILLQELKGKGGEGNIVDVAQGFAVNYLFPRGIALQATPGNIKQLEARSHNIEKRELARTTDAAQIQEALDGKTVTIPARVGEEGQLFGSITATQVAEAIADQLGVPVDRKKLVVAHPIKTAGTHNVTVDIYRELKAAVNVDIIDEKEAASLAAVSEVVVEEVVVETIEVVEVDVEEVTAE